MITNLIYHIFATDTQMMWWNVKMIKKYLSIFNGKRIFTIAEGDADSTDIIDKIINTLGQDNIYFIMENDIWKTYGGSTPFFEISAPLLASTNENEFLFHGHTKGASYKTIHPSVLFWTEAMYTYNLSEHEHTKTILSEYDTFGIFKCEGSAFEGRVNWHYPGAFWWVRHSALFSHAWDTVTRDACATEILPSQFIPSERAYNGYKLPSQFINSNKPYAADLLYDENCWKINFSTDDLTPVIQKILDVD